MKQEVPCPYKPKFVSYGTTVWLFSREIKLHSSAQTKILKRDLFFRNLLNYHQGSSSVWDKTYPKIYVTSVIKEPKF